MHPKLKPEHEQFNFGKKKKISFKTRDQDLIKVNGCVISQGF